MQRNPRIIGTMTENRGVKPMGPNFSSRVVADFSYLFQAPDILQLPLVGVTP